MDFVIKHTYNKPKFISFSTVIVRTNLLDSCQHKSYSFSNSLISISINKAVKIICYLSPWRYEYFSVWLRITISDHALCLTIESPHQDVLCCKPNIPKNHRPYCSFDCNCKDQSSIFWATFFSFVFPFVTKQTQEENQRMIWMSLQLSEPGCHIQCPRRCVLNTGLDDTLVKNI